VGVDFGGGKAFDATLDELALLAESAGDVAVARIVARRKAPDAALFVGSGKADEIKALVQGHRAEAVLFDQALSPAQQRNLEQHLGVAVADRTMLILEIFGERRAMKASCRSSWRGCNTSRPVWCGAGATSSASAAASATVAARARRRSSSTAA
jgi:50S ribosomal subunit-associated GTPase HflX